MLVDVRFSRVFAENFIKPHLTYNHNLHNLNEKEASLQKNKISRRRLNYINRLKCRNANLHTSNTSFL